MKKPLLIIIIIVAAYLGYEQRQSLRLDTSGSEIAQDDFILVNAIKNQTSDIQVHGQGRVIKVLRDDNKGSRHQRFIIRLDSGQTILIAHNIDLAPRIAELREGDNVEFYGEYEWNSKGGVVHWTHLDPAGRHPAGWLKHHGQTYQ